MSCASSLGELMMSVGDMMVCSLSITDQVLSDPVILNSEDPSLSGVLMSYGE